MGEAKLDVGTARTLHTTTATGHDRRSCTGFTRRANRIMSKDPWWPRACWLMRPVIVAFLVMTCVPVEAVAKSTQLRSEDDIRGFLTLTEGQLCAPLHAFRRRDTLTD